MSALLSAISGQFSKSVLLGTFFPVVLFVTGIWLLVLPMNPVAAELLHGLGSLDTNWKVLGVTFVVILLTGTLYNLNTSLIRLYEGYPWKGSVIGKWMTNRQRCRFNHAAELRDKIAALRNLSLSETTKRDLQDRQNQMAEIKNKDFPTKPHLILPTRLGNVLRNAETYSERYEIDAIELFPRLAAKIDSAYVQQMDDAKTQVDFMIHCSFLAATLAYIVLLVGATQLGNVSATFLGVSIVKIGVLFLLSYLCYLAAIPAAGTWGMNIKAVFDLYRASLLTQLGYDIKAADDTQEAELWKHISTALVFPDSDVAIPARRVPYALANPIGITVNLAKSTDFKTAEGSTLIQLTAQLDRDGATSVTIYDSPPTGMELRRNSLQIDNGSVAVTDSNPLRMVVRVPPKCQNFVVTYEALTPGAAKTTL